MIHTLPSIGEWWMWTGFITFMLVVLSGNLIYINRTHHIRVSYKQALCWTAFWVSLAICFNIVLWIYLKGKYGVEIANEKALEFFSGYLIEESLSFDNLFAFLMIFNYFAVPPEYQRRVLLYGILGAIFMRLIMILAGVWLIAKFHWILYVFGVFLLYTGFKIVFAKDEEQNLDDNALLTWVRKHVKVTSTYHEEKFFVHLPDGFHFTPLFLVLILVEISDVIFAIDSVPAIFGITNDPFIIFTSNIFAILGLRSLFFLLVHIAEKFYYIKHGVGVILIFIGCKMLLAYWFKIPIAIALSVVIGILIFCMVFSHYKKRA